MVEEDTIVGVASVRCSPKFQIFRFSDFQIFRFSDFAALNISTLNI